jgi:cell volume regulation protein A
MGDVIRFGALTAGLGIAITLGVLSNRLSERIRVPAPALFLLGAAMASQLFPDLDALSITQVQRVVTVALVLILFDGGMHIGWSRLRNNSGAVAWVGIAGTFVTAGAMAWLAHVLFDLDWRTSLLLGTALAPTDPAVVFSVLGRREVVGRSGLILEGESGANDPVGIALMAGLLGASGATGGHAVTDVAATFAVQMGVGLLVGLAGGWLLRTLMRRAPLPSEGLYPIRTLAIAFAIYGIATVAHGSGFLAVFLAGILVGDIRAPYKSEIRHFHSALASLGEIVAFTLLGLTIDLSSLFASDAWYIGLVLAVLVSVVVRPLLVGAVLIPVRLSVGERAFVLASGLKGAVPILLGTFVVAARAEHSPLVYNIIFVVVAFSVIVQGGLVPTLARWCRIPMRTLLPEPWAVGMRFQDEPHGLHRYRIEPGAPADGTHLRDLALTGDVWISILSREGQLVPVGSETRLHAGDEVLVLADPEGEHVLDALFHQGRRIT